ncbi:MAG: rod shape-determining protein MreD [Coriobacteriales bacterium]|jgi:rod shape-determining protein MreD|nr:rod shape-determining protein MreD [Coriobacteriales bacterium]
METASPSVRYVFLGGLAAFVAQVALAPNCAIAGVVPNLMIVATALTALSHSALRACVFGFVVGMLYDLASGGPLGVMALVSCIIGYALSTVTKGSFSESLLAKMAAVVLAALFGEMLHALVLGIIGYSADVLHSLVFVALPGVAFDALIGLVALLVLNALGSRKGSGRSGLQMDYRSGAPAGPRLRMGSHRRLSTTGPSSRRMPRASSRRLRKRKFD